MTGKKHPRRRHVKETYHRSGPRGIGVKFSAVKRGPRGTDGGEIPKAATM